MLTPKQEKFAQSIALDGMNKSDAYRSAYDTSKMSDKTVNEKASVLASQDKITARILELQRETVTPKVMSAQKRREKLTELAESAEDPNVAMKAIDLLNKMTGEYVQKVEAAVTNAVNISIELSDD
jgi:phage terminase small subunit